jgi:predicted dehydrogenase
MSFGIRTSTQSPLPPLALVGCGAAAREFCLPVLTKFRDFSKSLVLVDRSEQQAASVAAEFGIEKHCTDMRELPCPVEAAVITTPHHLHAEQAIHFLRQGIPVFVEKPLGMTAQEVNEMLAASDHGGATLMVNNCRRLFPSYQRVEQLIGTQAFGRVLNLRISDGSPFEWTSISDFYLRNAQAAKGVFLDRGAHTVDLVCWWLGVSPSADQQDSPTPQITESQYDADGGAEARMRVRCQFGQAAVELGFSRLFKLENRYTIQCEHAQITGRLFQAANFEVIRDGREELISAGNAALYHEYAWMLLENFIEVVRGEASPLFTAADVAPSIALIDEAYRLAKPIDSPWYERDPNLEALRAAAPTSAS